jgi:hypothetical protein
MRIVSVNAWPIGHRRPCSVPVGSGLATPPDDLAKSFQFASRVGIRKACVPENTRGVALVSNAEIRLSEKGRYIPASVSGTVDYHF